MKKFVAKGAVVAALFAVALLAGASLAAETVTVKVLSGGNPVEGAQVQVLASAGASSITVTNQDGLTTSQVDGKLFRVKVNGQLIPGMHNVFENLVTVEIN